MSTFKQKRDGVWTGKYQVRFEYEGKPYQKKGFRTIKEAGQWEADTLRELKNPKHEPVPQVLFGSLTNRYLDSCRTRMQLNTYRAKYKYFVSFLSFLQRPLPTSEDGTKPDVPAEEVTRLQALDYLEDLQRREGSCKANRHLKDLNALYNWANKHELVKVNPFKQIDSFPEEKRAKYIPPPEDLDAVILAAEAEEMDILICLKFTGGRIGEIRRLTWEDVNFEKSAITLWTRKRRGGQLEANKLAMPKSLQSMLERRWKDRNKESPYVFCREDGSSHTKDGKLRHLMEDLCSRADVKQFGFHAIRHHMASILADSGKATLRQIQEWLRHKRPTTTEIYLHEVTRDQREVADLLDDSEVKSGKNQSAVGKAKGVAGG